MINHTQLSGKPGQAPVPVLSLHTNHRRRSSLAAYRSELSVQVEMQGGSTAAEGRTLPGGAVPATPGQCAERQSRRQKWTTKASGCAAWT